MAENTGTPAPSGAAPTTAAPVTSAPAQGQPASQPQVPQAGSPKGTATPAQQAKWNWREDPRYGKSFTTEADFPPLYHSLEEIQEKKYKPAFQKMTELEKKFKDNQLDLNQLDNYFKEWQETRSPDNPKNQVWQFLNELIDDDVTAQDYQLAMKKLREEKIARRYPGMTEQQRQEAIARDKQLQDLQSKVGGFEHQQHVQTNLGIIGEQEKAIKELCTSRGFEFTDNIKKEFWAELTKEVTQIKGIENQQRYLKQMRAMFIDKYAKELDSAYENKIKASTIEANRTAKATTVTFAGKPQSGGEKLSFADRLRKAIAPSQPAT